MLTFNKIIKIFKKKFKVLLFYISLQNQFYCAINNQVVKGMRQIVYTQLHFFTNQETNFKYCKKLSPQRYLFQCHGTEKNQTQFRHPTIGGSKRNMH